MEKKTSRQLDYEDTHNKILKTASILFMEKGFKNTTTREIAEATHITQPNLYHHFKNKTELYLVVMTNFTSAVSEQLGGISEDVSLTLEDKLVKTMVVLLDKHPTNLFMMIHDIYAQSNAEVAKEMYTLFKTTYINNIMAMFEADKDVLRDTIDSEQATRFVLYHISAILSIQNTYQKNASLETEMRKTVDLMLNGLVN